MNKLISIFVLLLISWSVIAQEQYLLSSKYSFGDLQNKLIPQAQWKPFPKLNDRDGWSKADPEMLQSCISQAEKYLDYKWPPMPATSLLMTARTGSRRNEGITSEKRTVLGTLLLAEIAENKGRFVDQIVDGVWSICEESWWGVAAHLPSGEEYSGLPDVTDPYAELFSAETGAFLAWVDYFLGEKLDAVSPQIRKRIYNEVNFRLMHPLMTKYKNTSHQFHMWMGKYPNGRAPNNWNPWICSNWLVFALLLEKDEQKRAETLAKILKVLDEYINPYPQDGGCDEGPSYWGAAPASLYDNIWLLNSATGDAFRYVFNDDKIKNMGKFIYRAQISENYFLNFSDAPPKLTPSSDLIFLYGKDTEDKDMMSMGAFYRKSNDIKTGSTRFMRNFYALFMTDDIQKTEQCLPLPKDVWLPDLQVMIARDAAGSTDGFYLAAKGGNNDESHNHNDVGSFVVFYDGQPLLIDIGQGTYTTKSRYSTWFYCSDHHNLPTINGFTQPAGITYKATNVSRKATKSDAEFSMDLVGVYPDAGVNSWVRTVKLNRGKSVQIKDVADLKKTDAVTQHLMTCYPAEVDKPGEVVIHYQIPDGKNIDFVVNYNPKQMHAKVEKISLEAEEDRAVKQRWGDKIHRINFEVIAPKSKDVYSFTVKKK